MRETLYIRLRDTAPGARTAYAFAAEAGAGVPASIIVREAPLEQVVAQCGTRRVIVFVPGGEVRLSSVKVPARQAAKVLQAAPYILEEQFAEDVETLHFALGPRQADGSFPVAAVSRDSLEDWLAPFREQDGAPYAMVPETLALPWDGGAWAVLAEPGQLTARTGAYAGFSCVPEDFELYLQMAEAGQAHPLRVLVPRGVKEDYTRLQRPLELLPGFDHPLEALIRHLRLAQSINLLQGAYSQRENLERFWRPWRVAGGLLAAAFVLGVVANGVLALRLGHTLKRQDAANEARFAQLFPGERVNALPLDTQVQQKERSLLDSKNPTGVFFLLQQMAGALAATPGLELKNLEFRDGALFLELGGTDLQPLEKLRGWFGGHRCVGLEVLSADAGPSGVQIRLKLSPARCT